MGAEHGFYRRTLQVLNEAGLRYMIGGAFALDFHLGTNRRTKDLDLFVLPQDAQPVLDCLQQAGYTTEMTDDTWLGKAFCGSDFVDVIFAFGNGTARIDESWYEYAIRGELFGQPALFSPLEESLWSKAFVMERDRFDGADLAHIFYLRAEELDWDRLLRRFEPTWRVLLAHLVLFGFIYPGARHRIPRHVMCDLLGRLETELGEPGEGNLCCGAFFSRTQYVRDLGDLGMIDARSLAPAHK
jgi:hypothetical protein